MVGPNPSQVDAGRKLQGHTYPLDCRHASAHLLQMPAHPLTSRIASALRAQSSQISAQAVAMVTAERGFDHRDVRGRGKNFCTDAKTLQVAIEVVAPAEFAGIGRCLVEAGTVAGQGLLDDSTHGDASADRTEGTGSRKRILTLPKAVSVSSSAGLTRSTRKVRRSSFPASRRETYSPTANLWPSHRKPGSIPPRPSRYSTVQVAPSDPPGRWWRKPHRSGSPAWKRRTVKGPRV